MIKVINGEVHLTEGTLRAINNAVDKARSTIPFLDDPQIPLSRCDMSQDDYIRQMGLRGRILVKSPYVKGEEFWIDLELPNKAQCESAGYELYYPEAKHEDVCRGTLIQGNGKNV